MYDYIYNHISGLFDGELHGVEISILDVETW